MRVLWDRSVAPGRKTSLCKYQSPQGVKNRLVRAVTQDIKVTAFEIAIVLLRLDHVPSVIVHANSSIM
jgi:hypothetical protein